MFELIDILLPALVAGLLVLITHVPLGFQVLKRGIIFIDLAIAQIAGVGAVLVTTLDLEHHLPGATYIVAAVFALSGASIIALFERYSKDNLEALIGCLYVLSATGAYILLANDPHGGDLLKQVLSGQILWVTFNDLYLHMALYAVLMGLILLKPGLLNGKWFYFIFAVAITSSVQMVGVYLVFSTLIIPALATVKLIKYNHRIAYIIGFIAYLMGLIASALWDLPSGSTIVWTLAITGFLASLLLKKSALLPASQT
ncbi:metal ABC transporter permease [Thalassomonas sp. M1454]|uniref:metal ABC transporter permease n=1 Tax=Thalassomonas sp. M1454 TaxID=2594477 RepID=UPI00117EEC4F|nr:metal ABC transporter permease [Thalassomonas sp. M1454]TRX55875.1 metal ABC transporter permease [Thalassomonas sp. M1454]